MPEAFRHAKGLPIAVPITTVPSRLTPVAVAFALSPPNVIKLGHSFRHVPSAQSANPSLQVLPHLVPLQKAVLFAGIGHAVVAVSFKHMSTFVHVMVDAIPATQTVPSKPPHAAGAAGQQDEFAPLGLHPPAQD